MPRTEAQIRAEEKYRERVPAEVRNYRSKKSNARSFIKKLATIDDLNELKEMIEERLK